MWIAELNFIFYPCKSKYFDIVSLTIKKLHNLNQSDVAKIVGIEQSTYAKYERGEIPLNEIYAKLLADYYNVSLSYLFDDSNKEIIITQEQLTI